MKLLRVMIDDVGDADSIAMPIVYEDAYFLCVVFRQRSPISREVDFIVAYSSTFIE